ncbi:unnamed protein product [Ostreobium quekettii]|uniref:Uncharacterized protein n=1 Tax=Ostreobium quekettii TaxID=121088 RepID=A0A8S1IWJ4_9CHLO|nr:unnamed protein product [Ostreobium quekettii]
MEQRFEFVRVGQTRIPIGRPSCSLRPPMRTMDVCNARTLASWPEGRFLDSEERGRLASGNLTRCVAEGVDAVDAPIREAEEDAPMEDLAAVGEEEVTDGDSACSSVDAAHIGWSLTESESENGWEGEWEAESEAGSDLAVHEEARDEEPRQLAVADWEQALEVVSLDTEARDLPTLEDLCQSYPYTLDDFQKQAISELLARKSCLVCAPTGAGKTVIAEAAAAYFFAKGNKVIYTTPLKALSNQKLQEFRERFGFDMVGLSTGDCTINPEAPLIVMTTEILRNIMYNTKSTASGGMNGQERLKNIGMVVLDEVHYLNDEQRGSTWEELIINCPSHIQMLCMSATVANPQELGSWISQIHGECTTVVTSKRPVPLRWYFCYGNQRATSIRPFFNKRNTKVSPALLEEVSGWRNPFAFIPHLHGVVQRLIQKDFLPAIIFVFSRRECDENVLLIHAKGLNLTSKAEQKIIRRELESLRSEQGEVVREHLVKALVAGIASHHAGCLPGWKSLVERLFQLGAIKLVFATETLAAGINMPARTTVITKLARNRGGIQMLLHNELLQMAGRAGRRGYDEVGQCVILESGYEGVKEAMKLFRSGPEPLESKFATGYSLALNLLSAYPLEDVRQFLEKSFRNFQTGIGLELRKAQVSELKAKASELVQETERMATQEEQAVLKQYNHLKGRQETEREVLRAMVADAVESRSKEVQQRLLGLQMPCPILLDLNHSATGKGALQNALAVQLRGDAMGNSSKEMTGDAIGLHVVTLTADNQVYCVPVRHVVGIMEANYAPPTEWQDVVRLTQEAQMEEQFEYMSGGVQRLSGSLETARVAIKIPPVSAISLVPFAEEHERVLVEQSKKTKDVSRAINRIVKDQSRMKKASDKVRRRLGRAERMLKAAKKAQAALVMRQSQSWRDFKGIMEILHVAGALERDTLKILPLGQAVRELSGAHNLWMATVLTHSSVHQLSPMQLAALMGVLADPEISSKPKASASFPPDEAVCQIFCDLEEAHARLCEAQIIHSVPNLCSAMVVDVRLSGLVQAWAAGCSWQEVTGGTSLDDGDVARVLTRTLDLLRQVTQLSVSPKSLKKTARIAFSAMNRKPIRDLIV